MSPLRLKAGNKYGAQRCEVGGEKFDSKAEARRWQELKLLELAGEISGLERQRRFDLTVNGVRICSYIADFVYRGTKAGFTIVEDSKGFQTTVYRLKKKLMLACHGIIILETGAKRSWKQNTRIPSRQSRVASRAGSPTTNS